MDTWSQVAEIQPLATKILTNSIEKNRVSHAYLLQGERGTGKEVIARLMAKQLFCEGLAEEIPCNVCNNCKRISSGNHPDVHWVEPDGRSISIDQIRYLQKEFAYSGMESDRKVFVIEDADAMTVNAANSLLKFLEEPSKETIALLLTENSGSILPTIRSRCQVIDLKPLNPAQFQAQLIAEEMSTKDAVLMKELTNSFKEAFELVQDTWFAEARKLVIQLVEALSSQSDQAYLFIHSHWLPHFKDRKQQDQGLDLLLLAFRDVLYYHIDNVDELSMFTVEDALLEKCAIVYSEESISRILDNILQAKRKIKQNVQPTLVMEQLVLQTQR